MFSILEKIENFDTNKGCLFDSLRKDKKTSEAVMSARLNTLSITNKRDI